MKFMLMLSFVLLSSCASSSYEEVVYKEILSLKIEQESLKVLSPEDKNEKFGLNIYKPFYHVEVDRDNKKIFITEKTFYKGKETLKLKTMVDYATLLFSAIQTTLPLLLYQKTIVKKN